MLSPSRQFFCDQAFTPAGWKSDVMIVVREGFIVSIESGAKIEPEQGDVTKLSGLVVPGLGNVHSHGFQRGMSGLTEKGGPSEDHFWSWREVMYRFLERLDPDQISAITALAYMEMLESGFTSVGEFHYLHHDPDGRHYASKAVCAEAVIEAAVQTGIGLTLLPAFYRYGGFGHQAPLKGQRRFVCTPDEYETIFVEAKQALRSVPDSRIGFAPHSLRAVSLEDLVHLLSLHPNGPVHMHAAEQQREIDDCLQFIGQRPVEWLLDQVDVDARWCLVHCTHLNAAEIEGLTQSGAVAGLCPVTEANLGDGIFSGVQFLHAKGNIAVGTDSNVCISVAQELRSLEYSQRLRDQRRNCLAGRQGSTGQHLFACVAAGAEKALDRKIGALAPGYRADLVVLDREHPALMDKHPDQIFDGWIFGANSNAIKEVFVGGECQVKDGFHVRRREILQGWKKYSRVLDRDLPGQRAQTPQ